MEKSESSAFIEQELSWLNEIIITRLKLYFNHETSRASIWEIIPPVISGQQGPYAGFIEKNALSPADRICLMLSFVPTLKPQLFDCFNIRNTDTNQRFVEFGCVQGIHYHGLLPTFETLLFILAGDDVTEKTNYADYFNRHVLFSRRLILRDLMSEHDPANSAILSPSVQLMEILAGDGGSFAPYFSSKFPARPLVTRREWKDLVLEETVMSQIEEIKAWVEFGDRMLDEWELRDKIKPGYRALFYGPPGTGKTFTASLLGKYTGKEVYCIDLSMIVSKYIGETEKNLSNVFEAAENSNWILFFDEADALFGKRTGIKDAHDRYANQEVSYLLQRVEDYKGLVLLSSNLKSNIDEAFARRFQSIIRFPMPNAGQREQLWKNTFSSKTIFEQLIDLTEIARKYELSGGSILNVVRYCSLMSMQRNNNIILNNDILEGIRKEFRKEGRTMD